MAEKKLPDPPDEEEEELDNEEDELEEEPKKGKTAPWIRIGIVGLFFLILLVVGISMCGKRRVVQPDQQSADSTTVVQTPEKAQPQQQVVPQQQIVTVPQQQEQETATIAVPAGGSVLVFNYIIRDGEVQNGESTVALLNANGEITQIQINGEFYTVENAQLTKQGNRIVACSWGNTVYVINQQTADNLGLQARSPYKEGKSSKRRIQDVHIVRSGEYADGIRAAYGMKPGELKALNKRLDLNYLRVGDKLTITRAE